MNTSRVEKKREERARGIRANMDRINSRSNSVTTALKQLMGKALTPSRDRNVDECGEIRKAKDKTKGEKQIKTLALTQELMFYHLRPMLALKGRELTLELSRAPLTWKRKQIMKH